MTLSALALGVCMQLAAGTSASPVFLPTEQFTLAWDHSIEKVRWEENYSVILSEAGQPQLQAGQAKIKGSGSGREPPAAVIFRIGCFFYTPVSNPLTDLRLPRSDSLPDYHWCDASGCRPLSALIPVMEG